MSIWFCEMEVRCPKNWDDLNPTSNKLVRDCFECCASVHFISSQDELEAAALKGDCVAFYENTSMQTNEVEQLERIWELNKPSGSNGKRMTLGRPSTYKPFAFGEEPAKERKLPPGLVRVGKYLVNSHKTANSPWLEALKNLPEHNLN